MSIAEKLLRIAKNEAMVFEAGKVGAEKKITLPEINENNPLKELLQTIAENTLKVYNAGREWAKKVFATVSGTSIRVDDVSPTEHDLTVNLTSDTLTDFSSVTVSRYGKNLFDINSVTGFYSGNGTLRPTSHWKIEGDTLFCKIGYYSGLYMLDSNISYLPKGTYTISVDRYIDSDDTSIGETSIGLAVQVEDGTTKVINSICKRNVDLKTWERIYVTITLTQNYNVCGIQMQGNGKANNYTVQNMYFKNIQVEISEQSTDYEPYKELQTATATADGTVSGLTSVSPTMTLLTDTEGVTINCKYLQ